MQIKFLSFSLLVLLFSCNLRSKKYKEIVINNIISITVPEDYALTEKKGIDSYVFELKNKKGVLFKGDLGIYPHRLTDPNFPVFDIKLRDSILKRTPDSLKSNTVHFSEYPDEDYEQRIFAKEFYTYDTVNNIVLKLVQPKIIGQGVTGLYVPKLKDGNSLVIYTDNLDSAGHQNALQMFRTLKYR